MKGSQDWLAESHVKHCRTFAIDKLCSASASTLDADIDVEGRSLESHFGTEELNCTFTGHQTETLPFSQRAEVTVHIAEDRVKVHFNHSILDWLGNFVLNYRAQTVTSPKRVCFAVI